MNGFTAADMSTAAANGFRDGLAAQPAAAQEAVAVWTVTREGDPTFPRAYFSEAAADAMVAHITLAPFAVKRAPVAAAPVECGNCHDGKSDMDHDCPKCSGSGVLPSTPAAPGIYLRVRELLARRLRQWRTHLPADPAKPGIRAIRTYDHPGLEGETDYNNDVAIWREACSVLDEALTLIDASPKGGSDATTVAALHAAVAAIYFDDSSDYQSALWTVVKTLSPDVAALLERDAAAAYAAIAPQATSAEVGS